MRTAAHHLFAILTVILATTPVAVAQALPPPTTVVAEVNGETITLAELEAALHSRPIIAPLSAAQVRQLKREMLEEMLQDRLVRQFFRKYGTEVKPEEVEQNFKALSASLARQNKTVAGFLHDIGQTEAQARETWTTLIQLSRYVREKVQEDQLRQYYKANKDHFDRVELSVSHLVIRLGRGATPDEREAARQKLQTLRDELGRGNLTFADAARKHSQCPTATQGGDLGTLFRKGSLMDEAFSEAAFALPPGQVSAVVETEMGLHLIYVNSRKSGPPSAFEKCVEEVREAFTDDFRSELTRKLRKQASVKISLP